MGSKKVFSNPHANQIRRTFFDALLWKFGYYDDPAKGNPAPESFVYPVPGKPFNESEPWTMWINHSTFLIQVGGLYFLTDPIWAQRCSPLSFLGPKRRHKAPIEISELPKIDYVLISHDHYDHLDKEAVLKLFKRFPDIIWLVPIGVKKWFNKLGISKVYEFNWWEQKEFGQVKVTATPTQHFSGRSPLSMNQTLWCGYVVECQGKRFYFVGDTGYNPYDFNEIGKRWDKMDLSLIPIGSYVPRAFMSPVHIEPRDAVQIHQEVRSQFSIGMHWKTFRLSDEPLNQPPYDLFIELQKEGIDPHQFIVIQPGLPINW